LPAEQMAVITEVSELPETIAELGFAIVENVFDDFEIARLIGAISQAQGKGLLQRDGNSYAIRNLLHVVDAVGELTRSEAIRRYIKPVVGNNAFAVRGILFDKIPSANWKVAWHQDLTIEVRKRKEIAGFGPWSIKVGIPHVQPPIPILEQMLAVRIHLDDCRAENGPLRVIPGSHRYGKLTVDEMLDLKKRRGESVLTVPRGGLILMKPLLVHASSPAIRPDHRWVIHLEFTAVELPDNLEWFSRTPLETNCQN
jgi:Phytanoyl-CoA dioxygenase (PhyH)